MKRKLFKSLGILTVGIAPIATVISCSEEKPKVNSTADPKRMVTIDMEAKAFGKSFDDPNAIQVKTGLFSKQSNLIVDTKHNTYGPDATDEQGKKHESFTKQLKKINVGETKVITIFLPSYWVNHALANKKIYIKVKLHKFDYKKVELHHPITLSFEGRSGAPKWEDAIAFQGGTSASYNLDMSGHSFIGAGVDQNGIQRKGFEEQLLGMKTGDEKIIDVAFPKHYKEPKLAGQHAFFKVKILKIQ